MQNQRDEAGWIETRFERKGRSKTLRKERLIAPRVGIVPKASQA